MSLVVTSSFSLSRYLLCTDIILVSPDGLSKLTRQEGLPGLSKGLTLALFGVSNGAIQFMTYEELKRWRIDSRRNLLGEDATAESAKHLVRTRSIPFPPPDFLLGS